VSGPTSISPEFVQLQNSQYITKRSARECTRNYSGCLHANSLGNPVKEEGRMPGKLRGRRKGDGDFFGLEKEGARRLQSDKVIIHDADQGFAGI